MKNVLFATTAMVAMAGSAMAASHGGMSAPAISFSGDATGGYNDLIELGLFLTGSVGADVSVDMGNNVTATVSWGGLDFDAGAATVITVSQAVTAEFAYSGTFDASLRLGDLNDKGASEYFYKDRSGMALDVENQDNGNDARALVQFGSIGIAAGCDANAGPMGTCSGLNVGVGATFGSIKLGLGYDDAANVGGSRTAVSADATLGSFDVGASYITDGTDNSIGLTAGKTFGAAKVKGYYAMNSNALISDGYGLSVDYTSGAISLGAYFDNVDDAGGTATAASTYGVDLGYAVSDALKANAGVQVGGTTVYYAGVDYKVNSNVTATLSYATADAISGPEYKDGISAFITASF